MECKNCSQELSETENFCHDCGAKVIRNRLTIRNLWDDFSEQFLNYDNRFLKTFLGIFSKPHVVIGSYISGTRKKYVNVLSYFALALTFSGIQIFIMRKFYPELLDIASLVPENTPQQSLDMDWIYDYMSLLALINLPIYGLIAKITFIGMKKFNYTEHLVIMTYIIGQFSIINSIVITFAAIVFDVNYYILGYISMAVMTVFTAYTYKKLYPLSIAQFILRGFVFIAALIVLLLLIGIVQLIVMVIMAGSFEQFIEQQKAAQEAMTYIASSAINWTS